MSVKSIPPLISARDCFLSMHPDRGAPFLEVFAPGGSPTQHAESTAECCKACKEFKVSSVSPCICSSVRLVPKKHIGCPFLEAATADISAFADVAAVRTNRMHLSSEWVPFTCHVPACLEKTHQCTKASV